MSYKLGIDIITTVEAGGGGFGNPYEREPERVLEDIKNGFVTVERALRDYGVRVEPERMIAERT